MYSAFNMNYILKSPAVKKDENLKLLHLKILYLKKRTGFFCVVCNLLRFHKSVICKRFPITKLLLLWSIAKATDPFHLTEKIDFKGEGVD